MSANPPKNEPLPTDTISVEYLVTREFHNPVDFSLYIENEARRRHISTMEMLVLYCEERDIEPAAIAPFITESLKASIQFVAERLHLIERSETLPYDGA